MLQIDMFKSEVAELCRRLRVRRLDIFGSATSQEFGAESDVDVLVRFEGNGERLFDRYFDLKEGLEKIFGRSVDVVVETAVRNPYFRASIEASRRNVYAA